MQLIDNLTFVGTMIVDKLADMLDDNVLTKGIVIGKTMLRASVPLTSDTQLGIMSAVLDFVVFLGIVLDGGGLASSI